VDKKETDDGFHEYYESSYQDLFMCNICGEDAEFIVQLELIKERSTYNITELNQIPFYLCKSHEYLYRRMQKNIELNNYFIETIKENR